MNNNVLLFLNVRIKNIPKAKSFCNFNNTIEKKLFSSNYNEFLGFMDKNSFITQKNNDELVRIFSFKGRDNKYYNVLSILKKNIFCTSSFDLIFNDIKSCCLIDNIEQKNKYISILSHEIKVPLFSTLLLISSLKINERNKLHLAKIKINCNHILEVIDNLLHYNKLAYKSDVKNKYISLTKAINEAISIVDSKLNEHNIKLNIKHENFKNNFVYIDALMFKQVIINILNNAIKFSFANSEIDLTIKEAEKDNLTSYFEIIIKDYGIGMNEDYLKHLYTPYVTDENHLDKLSSTGIGLSICKKIADLTDSKIEVKSKKFEGSEFIYSFETKRCHRELIKSDINVLIIDDHPINIDLSRLLFEKEGFKTKGATTCYDGIKILENEKIDFIILDLFMPKEDGFSTFEKIRKVNKEIPIFALSASNDEFDIKKAIKLGFNEYIVKPLDVELIITKMYKYL